MCPAQEATGKFEEHFEAFLSKLDELFDVWPDSCPRRHQAAWTLVALPSQLDHLLPVPLTVRQISPWITNVEVFRCVSACFIKGTFALFV